MRDQQPGTRLTFPPFRGPAGRPIAQSGLLGKSETDAHTARFTRERVQQNPCAGIIAGSLDWRWERQWSVGGLYELTRRPALGGDATDAGPSVCSICRLSL